MQSEILEKGWTKFHGISVCTDPASDAKLATTALDHYQNPDQQKDLGDHGLKDRINGFQHVSGDARSEKLMVVTM